MGTTSLKSIFLAGTVFVTQNCATPKSRAPEAETSGLIKKSSPSVEGEYCKVHKDHPTPLSNGVNPNGYGIFSAYVGNLPGYLGYLGNARKVLPAFKGRAVMWGPNTFNALEGSATGYFFMILEFPSMHDFDRFYCSDDYQPALIKTRRDATKVIYSVAKRGDPSSIGVDSSSVKGKVKAFIIFNDVVTDQGGYHAYLDKATELAKTKGGIRLVSGRDHDEIEGFAEDKPDNLTVFVFPSMKDLKDWYQSAAYGKLKTDRLAASKVKFVLAKDGLAL